MKLWTINAFADKPFSGNPAAVTFVQDFPSDELCQQIAGEMNLSETAFVKPIGENRFSIRWFTPKLEVALCGHATLAAAHMLFEEKITTQNNIIFDSQSGPLFVTLRQKEIILDFPLQKIGKTLDRDYFQDIIDNGFINGVECHNEAIVELGSVDICRPV
jgi:PhzF family phenazine biosynthesis protein